MRLYIKCTRNGTDSYSSHDGMDLSIVTDLLTALGCSGIEEIAEETYHTAIQEN